MKKYTDNLTVRLHEYQENKLNDIIKNESYCRRKEFILKQMQLDLH